MPRRASSRVVRAVAGASILVLLLAATGCNAGRPPAATVGDTDIPAATVDEILEALIAADPETFGPILEGSGADTLSLPAASQILTMLVLQARQSELAQQVDAEPSDEQLSEAADLVDQEILTPLGLSQQEGLAADVKEGLSEETFEWLVKLRADTLALADHAAGEIDAATAPPESVQLCLRAIGVVPDAITVVDQRLAGGEDFGAVASDTAISVVPELAAAGGELGQCLPPAELVQQGLVQEVVDAIVPLEEGEFVGPADLGDGNAYYFELQSRQVDPEVALQILLADADLDVTVRIDPRFGTWDAAQSAVIPPEGARSVETVPTAPAAADPAATDPAATDPASDPAASDPAASDPAASDPAASDPAASDPAAADPAATDPAAEPTATEPAAGG